MEEATTEALPEGDQFSGEHIEYGYCTEFFIIHPPRVFTEEEVNNFRDHLERIGDSVVVAFENDFVKVHVHSNAPGKVLQMALRLGELDKLKIENMREQNRQLMEERKKNEKELGMVAVSAGEGLDAVFTELGADAIISGGQTMNPSIDTIAQAVSRVNARNVFVLPNNSNIILAAQQAAQLVKQNAIVLPTKTIPQGIAAAMAFDRDGAADENQANMEKAFAGVVSGAVTYAIRDSKADGETIKQGDIIGLLDNHISVVNGSVDETSVLLVKKMIEKKGVPDATVTIFYGEGMDEGNADALVAELEAQYPEAEFIASCGGQPLYYYFISVE